MKTIFLPSVGLPCGSIKNLPAMQETLFDPWVGRPPWRRARQPTPVFWPGEPRGRRSLEGYSPWGHKELDTTERLHVHLPLWGGAVCLLCGISLLMAQTRGAWHTCVHECPSGGSTLSGPACPHSTHLGACCVQGTAPVCGWVAGAGSPERQALTGISHRSV